MSNENKELVGIFIHQLRIENKFTFEDMASRLNISQFKYKLLEKGIFSFDYDLFLRISKIFNVDMHELINGHRGMSLEEQNHASLLILNIYRGNRLDNIIAIIFSIIVFIMLFVIIIFIIKSNC